MHDKYNKTPTGGETSMVVVTKQHVYTIADGSDEEEEEDGVGRTLAFGNRR